MLRKFKPQETSLVSAKNPSGSTQYFEKTCKERNQKYPKERWEKKKDLESTSAMEVNTTNSNQTQRNRRKNISQIICYNYSKKSFHFWKYTESKKTQKIVSILPSSGLVTEPRKKVLLVVFGISGVTKLQYTLCIQYPV